MTNDEKMSMKELHICRGLNACAGHGKEGSGAMPGDGACATAVYHGCATHNECRGQGGCGVGPASVQDIPGENACKGQGGCAVPVVQNISTMGLNKGKPVWDRARALFEERMKRGGSAVGKAPTAKE